MRTLPDKDGIDHYEVLQAMITYGGSFVNALGKAWTYADIQNHEKLWNTFSHYWESYYEDFVKDNKKDKK